MKKLNYYIFGLHVAFNIVALIIYFLFDFEVTLIFILTEMSANMTLALIVALVYILHKEGELND